MDCDKDIVNLVVYFWDKSKLSLREERNTYSLFFKHSQIKRNHRSFKKTTLAMPNNGPPVR